MLWRTVLLLSYLSVISESTGGEVLQHQVELVVQPTNICTKDTKLLIVVHSSMRNFGRRQTIRETYGQELVRRKFRFNVLFAMGVEKEDSTLFGEWPSAESEYFNDILQGQFLDTYNNMTTKALMWMRFVRDNCASTEHILHLDDDIMVDIFSIMNAYHIEKLFRNAVYCLISAHDNDFVIRDTKSKWFISKSLYENDDYPPFCSGAAYFLPSTSMGLLVEDVERRKYMLVDDALITGIARDAIRLDIYATNPLGTVRQVADQAINTFKERESLGVECASDTCMRAVFQCSVSSRSPIPITIWEVRKRPSIIVLMGRWLRFCVCALLLFSSLRPLLGKANRLIRYNEN